MNDNPENRDNARIRYKSPVTIENLKAGIIYQARMLNFSKYGLYFETDSLLGLGDAICGFAGYLRVCAGKNHVAPGIADFFF